MLGETLSQAKWIDVTENVSLWQGDFREEVAEVHHPLFGWRGLQVEGQRPVYFVEDPDGNPMLLIEFISPVQEPRDPNEVLRERPGLNGRDPHSYFHVDHGEYGALTFILSPMVVREMPRHPSLFVNNFVGTARNLEEGILSKSFEDFLHNAKKDKFL